MYFSQGLSLESYRSNYPLSIENFLHTAILIAEAVHDLHKKNEIIGVLTPANIKLSSHPYSAQITDLMSWNNAYRAPEYDNKLMTTPGQRSDLYSLGIIYYEMLAGVLPYQMPEDPNEWFYTHLIETPTSLILQRDDLPEIIEKMVFKLLNKAPSDRYASAYGLLHDLQKCYDDYCKPDGIQVFQLGLKDNRAISELTNIFIDRDVSNFILAFEQMKKNKGKNMLVSVAGDNGTGKTELVRQFLNLITDEVIVIGTSLEHNRSGDSLIVEAIRNGFAQLWFQDKKKILSMKDKIERECGDHISYIWTLFPVESQRLALYPQKLQADLKNQAQLAKVLAMLIKSFTLLQIPIIIAIDDLHVADELSHHVLEELIFEKSLSHTMIIGITENEEVPYTEHLLRQRKSSIIENERILPIQLQNFSYEEVRIFFQMLVHEDSMPMRLLARIAYDLSKGNPSQLKALVQRWMESNRLRFDEEKAAWNWDEIIEDTSYHLSSERLYLYREAYNRLNEEVKTLLYIASVIGMRFNVNQLCALDRQPSSKLISLLEQAEREGIICREDIRSSSQDDTDYLFLHTSIQQLLYQRFEAEAEEWHYKIGSYYWEAYKKHQRYEDCIDAAKHWNKVLPYLKADEQDALLQLNIINAKHYNWIRKHQEAVSAAEAGIALADRLGRSVEQKFEFYIAAAIGEHMLGNVNKSYAYLQLLMDHYDKLQTQDRIQLLLKQLQIYTFADQQEAYRIGKVGLLENGWVVPEKVHLCQ